MFHLISGARRYQIWDISPTFGGITSVFAREAKTARLSLTSTSATAATCTVAAATGVALSVAPASSADFRGAMESEREEFQEMDTTDATTDPTRKRRRDQTSRDEAGDSARKTVSIAASASRRAAIEGAADIDDDDLVDAAAVPLADEEDDEEDPTNLCAGWPQVVSRRAKKKQSASGTPLQQGSPQSGKPSASNSATNAKSKPGANGGQRAARAQFAAKVNANMAKTARMPRFANKDEIRVVIRPRGGLVIARTPMSALRGAIFAAANVGEEEAELDSVSPNAAQNIVVVSTPCEKRAGKYGMIRAITMGEKTYESYAYWATPENTSRGVISGVGHEESDEDIRRRIVNDHNPTAMAAHRLGSSTSVVILFEGQKVPHYIKYGGFITKCTLYRQHREVCKICGQVGHRKDVCPTPSARVCFACGRKNPGEDHAEYCRPKCRLCGGSHVTGAGSCKNKFKTPIQIKKRQWARQMAGERAPLQPTLKVRLSRGDEFQELETRRGDGSNAAARDWRKATSCAGGPTWADVTTGGTSATQRQRTTSRRRQPQGEAKENPGGAAAATEKAGKTQRERSASRRRGASRSDSTPRRECNSSGGGGGSKGSGCGKDCKMEIEELKKAIREMQLTIAQQRNTIAQLKSGKASGSMTATSTQQHATGVMGTPKRTPTDAATLTTKPRAFLLTATTTPPKCSEEKVAVEKMAEEHADEEVLSASDSGSDAEEEENAIAETPKSSATMAKNTEIMATKQPLGYAGLNNRIRQLHNITSHWGKNFESLEQRLLNKITQTMQQQQQQMQQQMQQFQQQIQQQQQQMQQQIEQQLNPERLQTLIEAVMQRYCNVTATPPSSP